MPNTYELKPNNSRKSFYGKAHVIEAGPLRLLKSYETVVAYRDKRGKLRRTWWGWSATTARHVDAFAVTVCNRPRGIGKAEWEKMPVEPVPQF